MTITRELQTVSNLRYTYVHPWSYKLDSVIFIIMTFQTADVCLSVCLLPYFVSGYTWNICHLLVQKLLLTHTFFKTLKFRTNLSTPLIWVQNDASNF
jgi:hypothetical protein